MISTHPLRAGLQVVGWTLAWLLLLDIATHFAVEIMARGHPDSGLVRYFQYGQSVETKLDVLTRLPRQAPDALILSAGWLDPAAWSTLPDRPVPGTDTLVAVYGQSFAFNASRAAARLDGHMSLRLIGGPAAPPDHSYAAYLADPGNAHADVVVFGILASSVPHMGSISGADWTFEHPAPFTFPHYRLQGGRLVAEAPVFETEQQFREAFAARGASWQAFKAQLARNDRGFDPLTFDRTWLDRSQIALLLRRAWAAHGQDYAAGVFDAAHGFAPGSEPIQVLRAMLVDLGQRAKARGQRLIVLLEQDQGYGDSLYRALGPTLDAAHIESISTHTLFSSGDPRNFQPDGHYTLQANDLFARRLRATIRAAPPAAALAPSQAHARYCPPAPSGPSCLAAAFLERAT
jgi:hypothetical protein